MTRRAAHEQLNDALGPGRTVQPKRVRGTEQSFAPQHPGQCDAA
jgi:hypothetical protein